MPLGWVMEPLWAPVLSSVKMKIIIRPISCGCWVKNSRWKSWNPICNPWILSTQMAQQTSVQLVIHKRGSKSQSRTWCVIVLLRENGAKNDLKCFKWVYFDLKVHFKSRTLYFNVLVQCFWNFDVHLNHLKILLEQHLKVKGAGQSRFLTIFQKKLTLLGHTTLGKQDSGLTWSFMY